MGNLCSGTLQRERGEEGSITAALMVPRVHDTCLPFHHRQTILMGLRYKGHHGYWWEGSRASSVVEGHTW